MSLNYLLRSQISDIDYFNNGSVTTSNALKGKEKLLVTSKHYNLIKIWLIIDNIIFVDDEMRNKIKSLVKKSV